MKFTINIPVTRKRTKEGYVLLFDGAAGLVFNRKTEAIKFLRSILETSIANFKLMTVRDFVTKKKAIQCSKTAPTTERTGS